MFGAALPLAGVNPIGFGDVLSDRRPPPQVQAVASIEARRFMAAAQRRARLLSHQPGATPGRIVRSLETSLSGGDLGFAWAALIPAIMPMIQGMFGGGAGGATKPTQSANGASASGGPDTKAILDLVSKVLAQRGAEGDAESTAPVNNAAFTPEQVAQLRRLIAQQLPAVQGATVPTPPPPPRTMSPCEPPDVWDAQGRYCYNPATRAPNAVMQPTTVRPTQVTISRKGKARKGGTATSRKGRKGRVVNGIFLADALGAPAPVIPQSKGGGILRALTLGAGALLVAGGATIHASR